MADSIRPGYYKHFKGKEYRVVGVTRSTNARPYDGEQVFCIAHNSERPEHAFKVYKRNGFGPGSELVDRYDLDAVDSRTWVLYQKCYDDKGWWIRPLEMFEEVVRKPDLGYEGPRFSFLREL